MGLMQKTLDTVWRIEMNATASDLRREARDTRMNIQVVFNAYRTAHRRRERAEKEITKLVRVRGEFCPLKPETRCLIEPAVGLREALDEIAELEERFDDLRREVDSLLRWPGAQRGRK